MDHTKKQLDYSKLFSSLPTAHIIMWADEGYTIAAQNEAHARTTFTKPEDVIGKPILESFPDKSIEYKETGVSELIQSLDRVVQTKKPDSMPLIRYSIKDESGVFRERWWRATHYPLQMGNGAVEAIYQVTEDITKEIITQQELDSTASQLQSALNVGVVSTWAWDMQHDVVIGDRNLAKSFGVSEAAALRGLPLQVFIDSIHTDDRHRVTESIRKAVAGGKTYEEEYRTVNGKGETSWVIARGEVVADDNGTPINFRGVLIDITGRKNAEAKLKTSETMFSALFDSTILAIAMADTDGRILQANKTFLKLFGYNAADLKRGLTSADLSLDGKDPTTRYIYDSLKRTGEAEPTEKKYIRKNGTPFSALVGAVMLPDKKDTFMAFILDTSEISRLKALNEAKDEFIGLASHQLRSPASVVKQYLNFLLSEMAGPISDDQLQFLNIANNANERQLKIINDLLKTAQLDTQGYDLQLLPKNVVLLTQQVVDQYEPIVDARNQRIIFEPKLDMIVAAVDETELIVCISNLIENASKYSPTKTDIVVTLTKSKTHVKLTVADSGVGIKPEDCDRIFKKFTRVDNILSDTTSGSGLGLYWVKRIVAMHGGTLDLKSEIGKGTTFSVRLPI